VGAWGERQGTARPVSGKWLGHESMGGRWLAARSRARGTMQDQDVGMGCTWGECGTRLTQSVGPLGLGDGSLVYHPR
jgi:hypothetical protein